MFMSVIYAKIVEFDRLWRYGRFHELYFRHEESFSSKSVLHLGFVCTKFLSQYLMSIFDVTIWSFFVSIFGQYWMSIFGH